MTSSPRKAGAVLSLGRIYCDMVFRGLGGMPQLGRELFARDFTMTPGGGALITAAHLSASGRSSALLARFGTDSLSVALAGQIEALGFDLQFLDRHETAGPQLTVVMVNDNDRAFLSLRAGHARPASFERALAWSEATHLHIAEYATLHEMRDAITAAKANGLTVSLDPSWDDELIRDPLFFERSAGTDVFLPNQEEAYALTGTDDPHAALALLGRHFPVVALKCGGDGALLAMNGAVIALPSPQVEVVDTTGAGDAFNAGFLNVWLDGASPDECLSAAITAGSRSVQASGGTGSLAATA
ncbi:carbohydrate kinase family protein [Devosia ginsengisoli]|uniref:carbohydrate kinase family protein n=1 Tax=Devosia ginsengisoli TaxID=400770 RepID=UPI0026F36C7E|nr:carbohydrate kinase family protein [Devosia ginsengisoli]MCR6670504.1 carbohydrate kinase family protein [Devosia ginsengisoli]